MNKPKIIYTRNVLSSFSRKDIEVLERHFDVIVFDYVIDHKLMALPRLIWQFIFLVYQVPRSIATVSLFGGYHSFLPTLFARLFNIPSVVILGGSDCVSMPSINYGNFNKPLQGVFTQWSLNIASHISTVDDSLIESEYSYTTDDFPKQGYKVFCPKANAPCTTISFGYDSEMFRKVSEKKPRSFLTVGFLNTANYFRKGVDLIFDQAIRRPDCTYTIIGGTEESLPEGVLKPRNVQMISSVSYSELVNHYSSHQFYFQLSMMEGFPSAICEAMLCECIPIGSNVAAIPNIIGDRGFILENKNVDQLHELVELALSQAKPEDGVSARNRIMKYYPITERQKLATLVLSEIERFEY